MRAEGRSWHEVFAERVARPAGLEMRYRAGPNPNLVGSIHASASDFARGGLAHVGPVPHAEE